MAVVKDSASMEQVALTNGVEEASILRDIEQPSSLGPDVSGDGASTAQHSASPSAAQKLDLPASSRPHQHLSSRVRACLTADLLLTLTLAGVLLGVVFGLAVKSWNPSAQAVELIGLPGELMLRTLKMLVLPLVAGSMFAGVCALRGSASGMARVAQTTLTFYALTTAAAVLLGIVLVNVIQPGSGRPFESLSLGSVALSPAAGAAQGQQQNSPLHALVDVIRNVFPDNVVSAAVNMNILGIITVSLLFGSAASVMGERSEPIVHAVELFNAMVTTVVTWVLWASPLGVASLIAASICRTASLSQTLAALAMWVLTVLSGLALQSAVVLPVVLWASTRKSPGRVLSGFGQALVMAFGTGSSSAVLPASMEAARRLGCDESSVQFVLPLGATINMNGTALYEAATVIFIAQAHGVPLDAAATLVIAVTATLAAVGAAAIPSAGLVTMLLVMQAVNLQQYASDLAVILALDWLLDRCRTVVNVLGDAFAVVTVDHVCKHHAAQADAGSRTPYSQLEMT